jgi:hypothetical protein
MSQACPSKASISNLCPQEFSLVHIRYLFDFKWVHCCLFSKKTMVGHNVLHQLYSLIHYQFIYDDFEDITM